MAMKRSGRFYRRNEEDVMRQLGLVPTKNSGSGWVEKEDGQNDGVICQLKSTDASSIRFMLKDWDVLEHNAEVAHKLPLFALQFLQTGDVFLLLKPEDLQALSEFIETGELNVNEGLFDMQDEGRVEMTASDSMNVRSSSSARDAFMKDNAAKYSKERKSAT